MNHKPKVNTSPTNEQANVVNTTFQFSALRQHLGDIEEQVLCARTFHEIAFDQLDDNGSSDSDVIRMIVRIDTLLKGASRAAETIQQSVESIIRVMSQADEAQS